MEPVADVLVSVDGTAQVAQLRRNDKGARAAAERFVAKHDLDAAAIPSIEAALSATADTSTATTTASHNPQLRTYVATSEADGSCPPVLRELLWQEFRGGAELSVLDVGGGRTANSNSLIKCLPPGAGVHYVVLDSEANPEAMVKAADGSSAGGGGDGGGARVPRKLRTSPRWLFQSEPKFFWDVLNSW